MPKSLGYLMSLRKFNLLKETLHLSFTPTGRQFYLQKMALKCLQFLLIRSFSQLVNLISFIFSLLHLIDEDNFPFRDLVLYHHNHLNNLHLYLLHLDLLLFCFLLQSPHLHQVSLESWVFLF
jgi:hypothetical protein